MGWQLILRRRRYINYPHLCYNFRRRFFVSLAFSRSHYNIVKAMEMENKKKHKGIFIYMMNGSMIIIIFAKKRFQRNKENNNNNDKFVTIIMILYVKLTPSRCIVDDDDDVAI
jgi:hypothetical protein